MRRIFDRHADSFVKVIAARLLADTEAMWSALAKVGSIDVVTYTAESSAAIFVNAA